MIDLESALVDLGEHLGAPRGDGVVLAVRARVAARPAARVRWRLAAAALVVVAIGIVAIPPSRHAVARWLGIGAVEVHHGPNLPSGASPAAGSVSKPSPSVQRALAAARHTVAFDVALADPARAGRLLGVEVDRRVRAGLVVLSYRGFTLTEIASLPDRPPVEAKILDPDTQIADVTVGGRPGLWITGPHHQLAYFDRDGNYALDTVRRAGPTLLWERAGVTFRVEGLARLDDALAIAGSLR